MRLSRIARGFGWVVLGLAATSSPEAGEDPPKPDLASPWKEAASAYRIELGASRPIVLPLLEEPVLKWTNPERKTDDGAVFLWTDRGRPEVAASFYRYKSGASSFEDHEFISLSTAPLSARRGGEGVWSVLEANLRPAPILDAPRPSSVASERLRQMRALAREFKATFNNPPDLSEIRLLPQPLYRFETEGKRFDVLDGALFAYVHTTDPEVLLMIEARPAAEGGRMTWHCSIARMSMVNLRVHRKDREVWSAEWSKNLNDPSAPYMVRTRRLDP